VESFVMQMHWRASRAALHAGDDLRLLSQREGWGGDDPLPRPFTD
jgi:hypothetical protein